jgi:hypothetical protein
METKAFSKIDICLSMVLDFTGIISELGFDEIIRRSMIIIEN